MNPSTFKWTLHGLAAGGTLALAALVLLFAIRPINTETGQVRIDVRQRNDYLATADSINARNRQLKGRLDETENVLAEIKRRIPDSAQEADFLAQLAAAAQQAEVEIVDYRPATPVVQERHNEMTVQLAAKGTYAALCRLLHRLETLPRLCHITGMEINAESHDSRVYTFDLTLQIFFSQKRAAVASIGEGDHD